jgi:predicted PurR-regulated permease PerM
VGTVCKDVLEPVLIGSATALQPVAVLMSILVWGSVWGLTGMVLAVPLTAVIRIYLEGINHPLPRYAASLLSGNSPAHHEDDHIMI